ncbi:Multidrug Resistance associated Protein 1 [Rhynchospora pubera]|uniref:ABC-type xenobiotic transporter n=1 Tax=Rhynchospora pubera TaxID=906938 RepID=A0AAV8HJN2_9POAL|nr:Multidrug Resistance associated Protein 1 [Rhynchospora pubera]
MPCHHSLRYHVKRLECVTVSVPLLEVRTVEPVSSPLALFRLFGNVATLSLSLALSSSLRLIFSSASMEAIFFPQVWDGKGFTPWFSDLVLGLGANLITVSILLVIFFTKHSIRRTQGARKGLVEVVFLHLIPSFGACLSSAEAIMLVRKRASGLIVRNHEFLFMCSQLVLWLVAMLVSFHKSWLNIFSNWILCFWWIVKILLEIPHFQYKFSSLEFTECAMDVSSLVAEIMFAIYINVVTARAGTDAISSIEDPLIESNTNTDENVTSCNILSLLTFNFVNPIVNVGVTKQLDFQNLIELPAELKPALCYGTLLNCWRVEYSAKSSDSSLFRVMYYSFGWPYLRLGLLKVVNDSVGFVGPLILNKFIKCLQQGSCNTDGYVLAILLGAASVFKSFLDTQYSFRLAKLKLMLRSSIMTIVYRKCLSTNLAEQSKFSEGEIQTFMSVDVDRTINLCNSLHDVWSLPLQIGVALYLLYTQVSYAFLSGLAITILLIPVNKWISTLIARATESMMKHKDERIRSTGELLAHIRTVKMYSWEELFTKRIVEKRKLEVKHLSTRKYLDAWCVYFWATTPTLFSLFTFSLFAVTSHSLDAATVFTCVALFNTLIAPLNSFPWVINGMIDAVISSRRLSKYLACPENNGDHHSKAPKSVFIGRESCDNNEKPLDIGIYDASCTWCSNSASKQNIILNCISLQFEKGIFVAVIGEVGSGKSSLINSILGEMGVTEGNIGSYGSISYVPQVPWILSGTLRHNILLGEAFDAGRYREVLQSCALDVDVSNMLGGDLSRIREKGVNLSGGQKARVALARAVYHNADIYLLDDILSAVDSQVALWILNNILLGPLMNHKTRVLCTHNLQAISAADMIVLMEKGTVKWAGTSADFLSSSYSSMCKPNGTNNFSSNTVEKDNDELVSSNLPESDYGGVAQDSQENVEEESRKEGRVEFGVYKIYAFLAGWPIAVLICVSALLMQASRNGNDLWLSYWVDTSSGTTYTGFYLVVLSLFGLINSVFTLVRAFSFAYGGLCAAIKVHADLLRNLVDAPVFFFESNPSGRVLNRLSSDLYTVDDALPFILNILLANFFSLLGTAVVLSYAQVSFLILLIPFWYIYNRLQFYYRSTSRELRRLNSVARSPIYSSFTETLDGSATIRAFRKEELFMDRFTQSVSLYQQTSYSELTAGLWLSLRLQLLAAFIILFISMMAVFGSNGSFPISFGTPGLVGLALSYAAPVVSLLSSFLTSFTETEKEMISVERIAEYMDIPRERAEGTVSVQPNWPKEGSIEFECVSLKYKPSLPAALNNVSFRIRGGLKVGIVGRTGAGKSSVLNALFRLTPVCNGRILIDGLDISEVAVRDLRSRFAVVPQSPFLFEGSLRDNLDPFGLTSEIKIWGALEKCHMKSEVELAGGLDIHVKGSGTSFSVGQRQLLCLARAIIKSSKILCLDECTANVDAQTALLLQNTISEECKDLTVVTIAHRISTVLDMDHILVLDHGTLVEQGNPRVLLKDESSRFFSFAKASSM